MGKVQTQPDYPRGVTFEQVWAALMENREQLKETDRIVKAVAKRQKEEADRIQKEAAEGYKELKSIVKENAKLIGNLGGRYGEMIEYMVKPNLVNKFNELGFVFTKVHQDTVIKDKVHDIFAQIDLIVD